MTRPIALWRSLSGSGAQQNLDMLFIEKQPSFAWHPDMLLDDAHIQISFLKDLVTLSTPGSRFSFLNYLREQGRLADFINLQTFFPSRLEFNDYLGWAANQFAASCAYGEEVLEVQRVCANPCRTFPVLRPIASIA